MRLTCKETYKSIDPSLSADLPDFTVITGLNGSGKTQLLESVAQRKSVLAEGGGELWPVYLLPHQALGQIPPVPCRLGSITATSNDLWKAYQHFLVGHKQEILGTPADPTGDTRIHVIRKIALASGKEVLSLTEGDFATFLPYDDGTLADPFFPNLAYMIKKYQVKLDENRTRRYKFEVTGDHAYSFWSEAEFEDKYGKCPWKVLDAMLQSAGLQYEVVTPLGEDPDTPYTFRLARRALKTTFPYQDLSTGEKAILAVILATFGFSFRTGLPKVLLLDEPAASLHPALMSRFLKDLHETFVAAHGLKVIITTHAPSCVALAPEDSLFLMSAEGSRLSKVSKSKALSLLTAGLPMLSVTLEKRRQVFVEAGSDAKYIEQLYSKLLANRGEEVSLSFIPVEVSGTGGCDRVRAIVEKLALCGNGTVFGIVDWDGNVESTERVRVLGGGRRDCLESYVFDPVLIGALLLRDKKVPTSDLGLAEDDSYAKLVTFDDMKLQAMSDKVLEAIGARFKKGPSSQAEGVQVRETCVYESGAKLNLPTWFMRMDGHKIYDLLQEAFPSLRRYKSEDELRKMVVDAIIGDLPQLVPAEVTKTIRDLMRDV